MLIKLVYSTIHKGGLVTVVGGDGKPVQVSASTLQGTLQQQQALGASGRKLIT